MRAPLLVMVAGPNGSGKSTLTDALRAAPGVHLPALYINADEIGRSQQIDSASAQQVAAQLRARAMAEQRDLMYETVMSHPSKLVELQHAKSNGYQIAIHFVATEDPAINVQRVALRVAAGGHDVPEYKTRARYGRALAFAPVALGYADQALVFDNSHRGEDGGLQLQALLVGHKLELMTENPAQWIGALRSKVCERTGEFLRIQGDARNRGTPLHSARLDGGQTQGPLELLGAYYAVQHDLQTNTLIAHDLTLISTDRQLQQGHSYRIAYQEGVGKGRALSSRRKLN